MTTFIYRKRKDRYHAAAGTVSLCMRGNNDKIVLPEATYEKLQYMGALYLRILRYYLRLGGGVIMAGTAALAPPEHPVGTGTSTAFQGSG